MKKIILALLLVTLLSTSFPVSAQDVDTHAVGNFTYAIPQNWLHTSTGEFNYYYAKEIGSLDDGYIMVQHRDLGEDYSGLFLDIFYDSFIENAAMNDKEKNLIYYNKVVIDGIDARQFGLLININGTDYHSDGIVLLKESFAFAAVYLNPISNPEQSKAFFESLIPYIKYSKTPKGFSPDDYKPFVFRDVARKPQSFVGEKAYIRGSVIQVLGTMEKGFELRIATKDKYDDVIYVVTSGNHDENILVGDVLDMYCTLAGDITYNTVMGSSATLPLAKLDHYKLIE